MGEEQALCGVEGFQHCHIFCIRLEVKYIEILNYTLFVSGLRDDHHTALEQESEGRLL